MFKKIYFLLCICCLWNCEQQPKQSTEPIETFKKEELKPETTKIATVDETNFKPFDISEYLSWRLLIGKSTVFKKENIKTLNMVGSSFHKINHQGLITASYDITNNYSEYTYTKSGLLKTIAHKQHSPALSYYEKTLYYNKDKTLKKSVVSKYNQQTKETTKETITDTATLQENYNYFKGRVGKELFKINRDKRIILSYRNDLVFCCGEIMPGKNSLHYYYSENQLIDSLVINGLESGKKMVFRYEYNN